MEKYKEATGYEPEGDDLERCNCPKEGELCHRQCGWCEEHDKPRFMCGCYHSYHKENN